MLFCLLTVPPRAKEPAKPVVLKGDYISASIDTGFYLFLFSFLDEFDDYEDPLAALDAKPKQKSADVDDDSSSSSNY